MIHDRIRAGHETVAWDVLQCRGCGLVFLDQARAAERLRSFYASGDYRKGFSPRLGEAPPSIEDYFKQVHLPAQGKRFERLAHLFEPHSSVLEIGCGSGGFLYLLKDKVASCAGVELDEQHARYGRSLGLEIHDRPLEEVDFGRKFDFVCMFHVLEHLPEPLEFARLLRRLLKPGGRLVVEVPGIEDPLLSVFGVKKFKDFYFQTPHLYYFSQKTLSDLLRRAGFAALEFLSFQQYSLLNHLSWVLNGAPFNKTRDEGSRSIPPGTYLEGPDSAAIAEVMGLLDGTYRRRLAEKGLLDTILCVASAPAGSGE